MPPTDFSPPVSSSSLDRAGQVRDLARLLFDRMRPFHGLGDDEQHVLDWAALLHDIPLPRSLPSVRQAIQAHLQSHAPQGFSPEQEQVLAAVIAIHRGRLKRKSLRRYGLSPAEERATLTLAALLGIAARLTFSPSQPTRFSLVEADRHELWVVVEGAQAASEVADAQPAAFQWAVLGYPPIWVLQAEEMAARQSALAQPAASIGLQPADPLAEAGRKVMRYHFAAMLNHEEGVRLDEDIEAVHDMRVATRRLRAAFEVFGGAFKSKALKSHLIGLRQMGRMLGQVRDLDVFLENAHKYMEMLPEAERPSLSPLFSAWQSQRDQAHGNLLTHLDSPDYAAFKYRFKAFLNMPGAGARLAPHDQPTPCTVQELAPLLIYTRLASVRSFGPFLENAPSERLHALRIEFKKLRYTVEYFAEVLGKDIASVIDVIKKTQDHLGELNDAQVATIMIRQFLDEMEAHQASLPISERENPQAIVNYLAERHAERHRLMVSFKDIWGDFDRPAFRHKLARAVSVL